MATMDAEDFISRTDVDTMTVLICGDDTEQHLECSEVEDLQNSLRHAVHDEAVRPKMQCLMMDPSFSMVTMQGEDSGIQWETAGSRRGTPRASEFGGAFLEPQAGPPAIRPATPGALPAGRIIVVMDEENLSVRRRRAKERALSVATIRREQHRASVESGEFFGRPELVGFSQPNVKAGEEQEADAAAGDREQRLFCLVAEGSEILNIVVPPALVVSVDEEESTAMEDNLSYLEESPVVKSSGAAVDDVFECSEDAPVLTQAVAGMSGDGGQVAANPCGCDAVDPPGAPGTRPQATGATSNVDYFEKFTLIDAQSPGGPAATKEGQEELRTEDEEEEDGEEVHGNREPDPRKRKSVVYADVGEAVLEEEDLTCALLDDVFYGGTSDVMTQETSDVEECKSPRSPMKPSGSTLFGSQEDILTPIFLPEGPAKIIDPILFEEPKAMAFLYTDLYEEATGSRIKEEDTESLVSEKSFHSRHSDREARGYLEKYVLIDETPVLETTTVREKVQEEEAEGVRLLSQQSYHFADLPANPGRADVNSGEDEITDFFRSSGNSSPCDMDPFKEAAQEEDAAQAKVRARLEVIKSTRQMFPSGKPREKDCGENRTVQPAISESYEFTAGDAAWSLPEEPQIEDSEETPKPPVPPRRKASSTPKTSLDLTSLRPVGDPEDAHVAGAKERRVEVKETASPVETADEGDGEREESGGGPSAWTADSGDEAGLAEDEGPDGGGGGRTAAGGSGRTHQHADRAASDSANMESRSDQEGINVTESAGGDPPCPPALVPEPAQRGQCVVL